MPAALREYSTATSASVFSLVQTKQPERSLSYTEFFEENLLSYVFLNASFHTTFRYMLFFSFLKIRHSTSKTNPNCRFYFFNKVKKLQNP